MPLGSSLRAFLVPAGATVLADGGTPVDVSEYRYVTVFYTSVGTTSGGTVILEEATYDRTTDPIYGGTWSQIESRAASTFTGTVTLANHLAPSAYHWIRARISASITGGGSISVVLKGTA